MSAQISWSIPYNILQDPKYTLINIYRGTDESNNNSYSIINTIDRWIDGNKLKEVDTFTDAEGNETSYYYYVKYTNENGDLSKTLLTTFELNPRQLRWVNQLRKMLDPIISSDILADGTMRPMEDVDLMMGINMALGFWNTFPPTTNFNTDTFPKEYEYMLLMFAQYFTILTKMLGLELRDFNYSDNGLSLNQQFTPAIQNALAQILGFLNPLLQKTKMEFSLGSAGYLGSAQFAVGLNGRLGTYNINMFEMFRSLTTSG